MGEPTIVSKAEAIHNNINKRRNNGDPIVTTQPKPKLRVSIGSPSNYSSRSFEFDSCEGCCRRYYLRAQADEEILESRDNWQPVSNNGRPFNAVKSLLLK